MVMSSGSPSRGRLPTNVAVSGKRESDERVTRERAELDDSAGGSSDQRTAARRRRRSRRSQGVGAAEASRTQRRMTLTGVAATTGISKSTLSRLETGQRRPTLELLLALSHAYRVPLDDLVGAPEEGDPRIRLKPGRVKGRTVHPADPATRRHAGLEDRHPDQQGAPRSHGPTTATNGSTSCPATCGSSSATRTGCSAPARSPSSTPQVPHWFGSTGEEPAEILSIFGRPGERMNVRTPEV